MKSYSAVLQHLNNSPKKWLVTGAAGFIGSNLVEKLINENQIVLGLDNFSNGTEENLKATIEALPQNKRQNFKFIEGDISNFSTCLEVTKGIDTILHEAALGSVPRSIKDPIASHNSNVTGFLNILKASAENGIKKFVYASSSSVYGDEEAFPRIENKVGNPLSPYAATKRMGEIYAQTLEKTYGISTIGLRYFNVFGRRQNPNNPYAAVIPIWMNSALSKKDIYIFGDGNTSRDFCYIDNVIQANILAAEAADCSGEIFNIAYGTRITLNELFESIESLVLKYKKIKITKPIHKEFRPGDVTHSLADISKAKNKLNYLPEYSVHQGLELAMQWYINQHEKGLL